MRNPSETVRNEVSSKAVLLSRVFDYSLSNPQWNLNERQRCAIGGPILNANESGSRDLFRKQQDTWRRFGLTSVFQIELLLEWSPQSGKRITTPLMIRPVSLQKDKRIRESYQIEHVGEKQWNPIWISWLRSNDWQTYLLPDPDDSLETISEALEEFFSSVDGRISWTEEPTTEFDWSLKIGHWLAHFMFRDGWVAHDLQQMTDSQIEKTLTVQQETEQEDHHLFQEFFVQPFDGSQYQVIRSALSSKGLNVQGPPGTGKSQTIVNIASSLVAQRKRVLIVAPRVAALEAVESRLREAGLGSMIMRLTDPYQTGRQLADRLAEAEPTELPDIVEVRSRRNRLLQQVRLEADAILKLAELLNEAPANDLSVLGLIQHLDPAVDPVSVMMVGIPNLTMWFSHKEALQNLWSLREDIEPTLLRLFANGIKEFVFRNEGWEVDLQRSAGQIHKAPDLPAFMRDVDISEVQRIMTEVSILSSLHHQDRLPFLTDLKKRERLEKDITLLQRKRTRKENLEKWFPEGGKGVSMMECEFALEVLEKFAKKPFPRRYKQYRNVLSTYRSIARELKVPVPPEVLFKKVLNWHKADIALRNHCELMEGRYGTSDPNHLSIIFRELEKGSALTKALRDEPIDEAIDQLQAQRDTINSFIRFANTWIDKDFRTTLRQLQDSIRVLVDNDGQLARMAAIAASMPVDLFRWSLGQSGSIEEVEQGMIVAHLRARLDRNPLLKASTDERIAQRLERIRLGLVELGALNATLITSEHHRKLEQDRTLATMSYSSVAAQDRAKRKSIRKYIRQVRKQTDRSRNFDTPREWFAKDLADPLMHEFPIWICTPAAVSAGLPLEQIFDHVLIDEAGLLPLQTVVPILERSRSFAVFGDRMQMTPGNYFSAAAQLNSELSGTTLQWVNEQLPSVMLESHYRSSTPALIAYANKHFYQSKLRLFASNDEEPAVRVLQCNDRHDELNRLAEDIHVRLLNGEKSILVILASQEMQSDLRLIIDERADEDPLFGKLLEDAMDIDNGLLILPVEQVQGEERDIVLIALGIQKNIDGKLRLWLGPIIQEGGELRLNVLFSRARNRMVWYSSILSFEIPKSTNPGVIHLKGYLRHFERGVQLNDKTDNRSYAWDAEDPVLAMLNFLTDVTVHKKRGLPPPSVSFSPEL